MKSFIEAKIDFDKKYERLLLDKSFVPVNGKYIDNISLKNKRGQKNEEYYKWQFIYSIINSGLYSKDYIGAEILLPKGNKQSAPIKIDACIFDDKNWINVYEKWVDSKLKDTDHLAWLLSHIVAVIEFKKENLKTTEEVFNKQVKEYMKVPEPLDRYLLGFYYNDERLFIFQRKGGKILRLDESYNLKGIDSSTKDLSLNLPDVYVKIPSFEQLKKRIINIKVDRAHRTVNDLDIITGVFSTQINDSISDILRTLDKVSLLNQRGYEILIQLIALKIFDEKKNEWLKYYIQDTENEDIHRLRFYIEPEERNYTTLNDVNIQKFIERIKGLSKQAETTYKEILSQSIIDWKNEGHVAIVGSIVFNLQDYSFTRSSTTDLYQLIFYRFANAFTKSEKAQFLTPIPVIGFLVDIVNPKQNEKIIDPTVGSGDFLSMAYVKSHGRIDDSNIFGIDNDAQMIMLAQLNMLLNGDGNAKISFQPGKGSITHKFSKDGTLISLLPEVHKEGKWDNWNDYTELMSFDVVLTNPPFGEDRKYEPKTSKDKEIIEMYELWHIARCGNWIDLGLVFLENAYRILDTEGRLGIVLSNSIASIERWEKARSWLVNKMRIVALFDLPPNVFADTGVNTTLIIAYKPKHEDLLRLNKDGYEVFVKDIQRVGYEIRTSKRVKYYSPSYKIDENTFDVVIDEHGAPVLDEEFTETVKDFRNWAISQEDTLKKLFL